MTPHPMCALCGRSDASVLTVEHPTVDHDRRRPGHRHHHATCASALRAHQAVEAERTHLELDAAIRRHEDTRREAAAWA